jgi:hypothetical protein
MNEAIFIAFCLPAASDTMCVPASTSCIYPKRLSATDISALASMKNVAKCDTWCELQNPVNHRVFERKLCPTPFVHILIRCCVSIWISRGVSIYGMLTETLKIKKKMETKSNIVWKLLIGKDTKSN